MWRRTFFVPLFVECFDHIVGDRFAATSTLTNGIELIIIVIVIVIVIVVVIVVIVVIIVVIVIIGAAAAAAFESGGALESGDALEAALFGVGVVGGAMLVGGGIERGLALLNGRALCVQLVAQRFELGLGAGELRALLVERRQLLGVLGGQRGAQRALALLVLAFQLGFGLAHGVFGAARGRRCRIGVVVGQRQQPRLQRLPTRAGLHRHLVHGSAQRA
jgi:hypothetical protein